MRVLLAAMLGLPLLGAPEEGKALFETSCATCHKNPPVNRAPLPDALMKMSRETVLFSMEKGSMKEMAASLSAAQRLSIAEFLTAGAVKIENANPGMCAPGYESRTDSTYWNGWGVDATNSRFQPANMARLSASDVPKLQLKWAFGFAGPAAMAQPTIAGGKLYFGSVSGAVFATDAKTGCIFWQFKAPVTTRTAISIATVAHAKQAALFGDVQANVYAVDTKNGSLLWKIKLDDHPVARITGAPKLHNTRLYVPISSIEEVTGGGPKYQCCTFRGSVAAIDIESGKLLWKTHTIPDEPKPTRKNAVGTQLMGPSGAAVWLSPTLDLAKRMIYVGTGNAYSEPHTKYSDAIVALDMDSGAIKWAKQLASDDGWNFACVNPTAPANCPQKSGPDVDIGTSPILRELGGGKRVLVVGQKNGVVHGLDPDAEGNVLWQTRVGEGGALGGVQWGMAADENNAYVALSDVHKRAEAGGLFALSIKNGEKVWYAPPVKPACLGKPGCSPAQMAAVTVIPGVVFSGGMDGVLRAYDSKTGKIVWEFDSLRDFETVNGVKAKGGSMSATGPVIAGGMLFVNSGYGMLGGMAGNVLLAFEVAK